MSKDEGFENVVFDGFDLADENLQGWDGEGGGPPEIPPGEYTLEVKHVEVTDTNAGDGKNFVVTYAVADEGPYADKEFKQWYLFNGKNVKEGHRRRIAHVMRDCLRVPINGQGGFETKDLLGLRMSALLGHESYTKHNPLTQQAKEYVNITVSGERPLEGAVAAAPAPTPNKATAAAPKAPARPPAAPPRAPASRPPATR